MSPRQEYNSQGSAGNGRGSTGLHCMKALYDINVFMSSITYTLSVIIRYDLPQFYRGALTAVFFCVILLLAAFSQDLSHRQPPAFPFSSLPSLLISMLVTGHLVTLQLGQ